jgi:hypothetical protein
MVADPQVLAMPDDGSGRRPVGGSSVRIHATL